MERRSLADAACPVARSLDVVGPWWTLLIVRDALLGVTRFDGFAARLPISRNALAARLAALVAAGILERAPLPGGGKRLGYALTADGRALAPVILALKDWGERHRPARSPRWSGPPPAVPDP